MYLYQSNQELVKSVNLEKRAVGSAAGYTIAIIFVIIVVFFTIGLAVGVSNKAKTRRHQEEREREEQQRQETTQSNGLVPRSTSRNNEPNENEEPTNQSEYPDDLVPPYTAKTNENDMGYFDDDGVFHENIDALQVPPMAYIRLNERSFGEENESLASSPVLPDQQQQQQPPPPRVTPMMLRTLRY